ncbi:DNA-directed RNA polymerase subunit alpha [Candidatus Gracilibacteria bacterium]|nr:DNA-directed RNA polymerase subunit alpha [Candidatus Gracilibacteria bacterium]MCF7897123.1 DNA-directed RNA polymerase subunit alpha [Candidatus Gracilibacteria bacterium]
MHIIQQEIGLPKIVAKKVGDNHTLFTVAPLPNGYGMTLGNSFRRVLLSSLPGAAVAAVKIKGATHEYSTLSGVKDSMLDMLLNLKHLNVKKHSKKPTILKLEVKNRSGEITAKDIEKNSDVEILNPDLVITTLDKKGELKMEIVIEKDVGYLPAAERQKKNKEVGLIYLDAMFSPVERVRYDVTATRVGQMTNLDKLEIEVKTNGSMTPENSMKFASNILKSYFDLFNTEEETVEEEFITDVAKVGEAEKVAASATPADDDIAVGEPSNEKYTPIETLQFSPRTLNALINGGIGSVEQLIKCNPNKIAELRGFGNKALDEVNEKLAGKDLKLEGENE